MIAFITNAGVLSSQSPTRSRIITTMERIIDKTILLILAAFATISTRDMAQIVMILFTAVALLSATSWMNNNGGKWEIGTIILDAVAAVLAIVTGQFLILVPMIIYDMVQLGIENENFRTIAGIIGIVAICAVIRNINPFVIVITLIAGYIAYRTYEAARIASELLKSKDTSTISQDELKRKNRQIMEERERELYLGTITERNRIAREIHDNVGHMLSRSILMVGAMMTVHKEEPVHSELDQLQDTLNNAMTSIRKSVHDLRDDAVDLKESINDMVKPLRERFEVNINVDDDEAIPSDIKYAISSICKECISNIIKYSTNDTVSVMVNIHPSMYQVEVRDFMASGTGAAKKDYTMTEGMGLANITKRAEDLGGRALITNTNGFRVFVTIPKRK